MRLIRLTVSNFKALKGDRVLEFNDGIVGITGNNGRGKSTIANAIGWTLYGPDILPTGKADVVSWGEQSASCSLLFEMPNGDEWNITREQTAKGVGSAELWNLTTGQRTAFGLDPVNREVIRLLGLDRVGFLISVYARQEELAGIMSLTPANRMKTILRLLGIEQLTTAIESTRTRARESRKILDGLRYGILDPDLIRGEIIKLEEELKALLVQEADAEGKLADIEEEHDSIAKQYAALLPQRKEYEEYRTKLSDLTYAVRQADAELQSARKATIEMQEPPAPGAPPNLVEQSYIDSLRDELRDAERTGMRLSNEIDSSSSECPYCHRAFSNAEQIAEHVDDLRFKLEENLANIDSLSHAYDKASVGLNIYNRWLDKKQAHEEYRLYEELQHRRHETALAAHGKALGRLATLQPVQEPSVALDGLQGQMRGLESAGNQIRIRLATLEEQKHSISINLGIQRNILADCKSKQSEIEIRVKEANHADVASSELVRLKEKMISQIIPSLSDRASNLLSKFTEGRYSELLITPSYEIQFRNDFGELKSFENLSGGEKDVFALALRLAIGEIRADSVGVLILDEVMESLDADRQEATWQAIERLTSRYNQIFLVTHVQAFKDRAVSVISL